MTQVKDYTMRACPLCGGDARIVRLEKTTFYNFAECVACGSVGESDDSFYGAIVAWNTGRVFPSGESPHDTFDYHIYIQSSEWRQKAEAAKERAGQRCQICNRPRSEVTLDAHHRTYERLGNESPDDITVLCRDCHGLYEANKRAKRGTP